MEMLFLTTGDRGDARMMALISSNDDESIMLKYYVRDAI